MVLNTRNFELSDKTKQNKTKKNGVFKTTCDKASDAILEKDSVAEIIA